MIGFDTRLRIARIEAGERRRDKRYTQDEFADLISVKRGTLRSWEAGNSEPEDIVDIAQRIERKTGVSAAWLLGVDEPDYPTPDDPSEQVIDASTWIPDNVRTLRAPLVSAEQSAA